MVIEISGRGRSAAIRATRSGTPRRSSGSPPVSLTSVTPSETAIRTSRMISSSVSSVSFGSQSSPSGGMQYAQRSEQRSINETRRSVATRPNRSTSFPGAVTRPL